MQFVNIIVHSVEDMNFRVHLQYEFTALKLDDYLERLRLCESDDLQVNIHTNNKLIYLKCQTEYQVPSCSVATRDLLSLINSNE